VADFVSGRVEPGLTAIQLDLGVRQPIQGRSGVGNMSEEALLVAGDRVLTLHEVNGRAHNPAPVAHVFGTDLQPRGTLPFPQVEYRITDATPPDASGRFWAINYFFPGEQVLRADVDPLAERFGRGPTHARSPIVERLLAFVLTPDGIRLDDTPPLQLQLRADGEARNWEAIAVLEGRGLLVATDLFPETVLGFVPVEQLRAR
jgi:hypothetical protein